MCAHILRKTVINTRNKRISPQAFLCNNCFGTNEPNVIRSALPEVDIPNVTLHEHVFRDLEKWPKKVAIECGLTGRKYTFEELRIKARNLNKSLRKILKLQKGYVVAILLPNVPEYPIALLGALEAGLVVTTVNPIYTPEEIGRQLEDSDAKVVVTLTQLVPLASAAAQKAGRQIPIISIKSQQSESTPQGSINFGELVDTICDIDDVPPVDSRDVAIMPYSSGTTGLPKGVELTHHNLIANMCQINEPSLKLVQDTTDDHQDVVPCILPMYHIYGITVLMHNNLHLGCKLVSVPKFTPELFVSVLEKHRPNLLYIVPPIVLFMVGHPSVKKEYMQSVRSVVSGAAPLGALDEDRLQEKAGKSIHMLQGFGMTETSPAVCYLSPTRKSQLKVYGSVGEAISNTSIKVVPADNPSGPALGPNENGELLVKGPQVMKGYHNAPDKTKEVFLDGWLRTGDLVYYDQNRIVYVTDRLKELIKVKGFQVAPAELEEIVRDFPNVADAAVIGIPHLTSGEVPRAYVVAKPGAKLEVEKLQEFVNSQVSPYKALKGGVCVVSAIPKNAAGKIMRRELRALYKTENKRK